MKRLLTILFLTLAFAFAANAQTVEISQETADKAAAAFAEVKVSRAAIDVLKQAREVDAEVINGQKTLIESYQRLTTQKDEEIKNLRGIIAVYDKNKGLKISLFFGLITIRRR